MTIPQSTMLQLVHPDGKKTLDFASEDSIHRKGLWHAAVYVSLVDSANRVAIFDYTIGKTPLFFVNNLHHVTHFPPGLCEENSSLSLEHLPVFDPRDMFLRSHLPPQIGAKEHAKSILAQQAGFYEAYELAYAGKRINVNVGERFTDREVVFTYVAKINGSLFEPTNTSIGAYRFTPVTTMRENLHSARMQFPLASRCFYEDQLSRLAKLFY